MLQCLFSFSHHRSLESQPWPTTHSIAAGDNCALSTPNLGRLQESACLANYLVQNWEWSKEPKWTKFVDWTDSSSRRCTRSRPVIFAARGTDTSKIHQGYAQGRVPPSRTFVRHFVLDSADEQCCELKGAPSPTSSSPSWNMTERFISFVSPVEFVQMRFAKGQCCLFQGIALPFERIIHDERKVSSFH